MRTTAAIVILSTALLATACSSGSEAAAPAGGGDSPAASSSAGGGGDFCSDAREIAGALDSLDFENVTDPSTAYGQLANLYDRLAGSAPAEIRDDATAASEYATAVAEWAQDPLNNEAPPESDGAAFEAASNRLDAYMQSECGIG